jgi:hypothetical protein
MKAGDRIKVVYDSYEDTDVAAEGNLIGWTGVITKVWPDGGLCVDLDPEQDPEDALDALHFDPMEVEVVIDKS